MSKHRDLQPWLDYFDMLQKYEQKGFLEVRPDMHEAFVTRAALYTLTPGYDQVRQISDGFPRTARALRAYAAFKATASDSSSPSADYLSVPFALHVVKEDEPHDLLYTFLLSRRRRWFSPWRKSEKIEVISYYEL